MLLIDYSAVVVSNLLADIQSNRIQSTLDDALVRHTILDTLRSYNAKFKNEYGRMVLCIDGRDYWRKKIFPYYKFRRQKDKEKNQKSGKIDWKEIYRILDMIKEELRENFPYQIIEVAEAEADDSIAVLSRVASETEKVLIVSSDHDLIQLVKKNVDVWQPRQKTKYIWSII